MTDPLTLAIPWKIVAASPDMMDVTFNNRRFPFAWRSSLAIAVYEPPATDLPADLCGQRVAFVKVSCSLTGYQSATSATREVTFSDVPTEELERLTTEYLGCYGALLNVAFFPADRPLVLVGDRPDLAAYPHVLDFTPKVRELVRSITEGGELLTGSTRSMAVDQSMTTTTKNETTVGVEAGYKAGGLEATGKLSHTWGTTEAETSGLEIDSGESRSAKTVHSTTLDQLYSLLTGYHSGTNRATFIMLARPGTLQPTNRRTFAPGLRMLEGVQDFILVVSRPAEHTELCIEATLNTGHFPEKVELVGDAELVERRTFLFTVRARARGGSEGFFSFQGQEIVFGTAERPEDTFSVPGDEAGPWTLDVDAPGTEQGIQRGDDRTRTEPPTPGPVANEYDLRVIRVDDRTVQARGRVVARGGYDFTSGPDTIVDADFIIHVRRVSPSPVEPSADRAQMLVTNRSLHVCYRSVDGCPEVFDPPAVPDLDPGAEWLDDIPGTTISRSTGLDGFYSAIRSGLILGAAGGGAGSKRRYLDTDYFSHKVARAIPKVVGDAAVAEVTDLSATGVSADRLGKTTVQQLLSVPLRKVARGLEIDETHALELRRAVLRYVEGRLRGKPGAGAELGNDAGGSGGRGRRKNGKSQR